MLLARPACFDCGDVATTSTSAPAWTEASLTAEAVDPEGVLVGVGGAPGREAVVVVGVDTMTGGAEIPDSPADELSSVEETLTELKEKVELMGIFLQKKIIY